MIDQGVHVFTAYWVPIEHLLGMACSIKYNLYLTYLCTVPGNLTSIVAPYKIRLVARSGSC